jgi:hypothetical protein
MWRISVDDRRTTQGEILKVLYLRPQAILFLTSTDSCSVCEKEYGNGHGQSFVTACFKLSTTRVPTTIVLAFKMALQNENPPPNVETLTEKIDSTTEGLVSLLLF